MKHPALGSVINVREDSVDRYTDAGYEPVKASGDSKSPKRRKSTTTKK
jgi:hypothetical protein